MNKASLKGFMALNGDTQETLASALGMSLSRFNAKINERDGAEFTQSEICAMVNRYQMTPEEAAATFFDEKVSK